MYGEERRVENTMRGQGSFDLRMFRSSDYINRSVNRVDVQGLA